LSDLSLPSVAEVRAVISTSLTDDQVESLIVDASIVVDQCAAVGGYDVDVQAAIIKYWTADIISTIANQGAGVITADRLGDAARSFSAGNDKTATSFYRQRAYDFDPSGCLRRIGKPQASFQSLSTGGT
jgi:hypothetical protein